MKEIRKKIIKIVSIVLAAAMIGTSSGLLAFAAQGGNDNNTSSSVSDSTQTGSDEKSSSDTDGKEETVYIISNADGTTKKVIVSDWLKNGSHNATIEDETSLKDIKNVKGNESFTNSGENYKWAAEGSDIYYQGTTDKTLPVDMKITYTLDGKTVTPDEIKSWGLNGGKLLNTFDTDCAKIGVLICYDVEFPELSRLMADQGMQILFVPFLTDTQNAYSRVRVCAQARAIENECFVVIAGSVGNLPRVHNMDIQYAQSGVFTPCDFAFPTDGKRAEATPNTEMILVSDVDLDLLNELHTYGSVRNLKDRRNDLYEVRYKK